MQQTFTTQPGRSSTLKMAGPYILAFGVLQILFVVVSAFVPGPALLWGILNLVLSIALFAYAGYQVARVTGKAATGAMVGLWTGLFGGLIGFVASLIQIILSPNTMRQAAQMMTQQNSTTQNLSQDTAQTIIFWTMVFLLALGWAFAMGLGSASGVLGGISGRGKAHPVNETPAYASAPPVETTNAPIEETRYTESVRPVEEASAPPEVRPTEPEIRPVDEPPRNEPPV